MPCIIQDSILFSWPVSSLYSLAICLINCKLRRLEQEHFPHWQTYQTSFPRLKYKFWVYKEMNAIYSTCPPRTREDHMFCCAGNSSSLQILQAHWPDLGVTLPFHASLCTEQNLGSVKEPTKACLLFESVLHISALQLSSLFLLPISFPLMQQGVWGN